MSQVSNIFRLQQIDSQLDNALTLLKKITHKLSDTAMVRSAQDEVDKAEIRHKSESKRLREAENKSYDTRIKIELSEASLYGGKIQNPKELQDLQNEIASLKRLVSTLEDKELEAMLAVEEAESSLAKSKVDFTEIQAKQIELNSGLSGEKTRLENQIERLESERAVTTTAISPSDLAIYEQLRKSRSGVAVVKISSRACTACGATLTAALVQSIQTTSQLVRCPTCGRILYSG